MDRGGIVAHKRAERYGYHPRAGTAGASITLNNGEKYLVDFKNIDGKRSC